MRKDVLRYVADSIAIESMVLDPAIEKQAGLFEDMGFGSIASSITNKIRSVASDDDSPAGVLETLKELLISGALFKVHWALGLTYAGAKYMGVDLIGIGKKILDGIWDAAKGGVNKLSLRDVDEQGKIAIAMYNSGHFKTALFGKSRIDIPFFGKGNSTFERVFGNLFRLGKRSTLRTLFVAILIWTLKTALLGAGLLGGAALIGDFVTGKKKEKEPEAETPEAPEEAPAPAEEAAGAGYLQKFLGKSKKEEHTNDHKRFVWMVPLVGRSIPKTLSVWAEDIYPELSGYTSIYSDVPSFRRVVDEMSVFYNPDDPGMLKMPSQYTSRQQVVDQFAGDIKRELRALEG